MTDAPRVPDFFNVFATEWETMTTTMWPENTAEGRILYEAPDRTLVAVASRYPNGVTFNMGPGSPDIHEVFFVYAGEGSRTYPDGTTVPMGAGDFIYNTGEDITYVYGPGFADIAVFWSTKPLPEVFTAGLTKHPLRGQKL
ncbi:MAG TPA: hypothetical protein VNT22_04970 [Baekduia sp.]|nr:hypothetical protein [Baekduia sp.]